MRMKNILDVAPAQHKVPGFYASRMVSVARASQGSAHPIEHIAMWEAGRFIIKYLHRASSLRFAIGISDAA